MGGGMCPCCGRLAEQVRCPFAVGVRGADVWRGACVCRQRARLAEEVQWAQQYAAMNRIALQRLFWSSADV